MKTVQMGICRGDMKLLVDHKDAVSDVLRKLGLTDVVAAYREDKMHWETVAMVTCSADDRSSFRRVIAHLRKVESEPFRGTSDPFICNMQVNVVWNGTSPWDEVSWEIR